MPPIIMRAFLLSLILAPISAGSMRAQSPPAPAEDPQKAQEERIRKLEEEVQALKAAQANAKVNRITVPAAVQAGDAMLLFATSNSNAAVAVPPNVSAPPQVSSG